MPSTADSLPIFDTGDGWRLIANERVHPGGSPFQHDGPDGPADWNEDELRSFCAGLWHDAYDAKRPEMERLKTNSLFYDGFQFVNAWQNRISAITNRIYAIVEQQVSVATIGVPRPEIIPRGWDDSEKAQRIQQAAEWLEDTSDFDQAIYVGARDKFIFGYNVWLITFDAQTGMPYVKNVSVFDYYWDPAARNEDEAYFHIIAQAVSTHRLRATYPDVADEIEPDSIASPSYEVTVKPWREYLEYASSVNTSPVSPDFALNVGREAFGNQAAEDRSQGTAFTADTGQSKDHGTTTFIVQFLVRDEATVMTTYTGTWLNDATGESVEGELQVPEPRTESGWWVLSVTSAGKPLHQPYALDSCYLGIPLVIDRNHQRTDRFESMSETDHMIPIQRGLNRRKLLIMRALELSANPPVIATSGHGMQLGKGTVGGGELLTINRGSDVKYLEFRGPAGQQFEMQSGDDRDLQSIAGVPDVQRGIKPAGVEAAAAIRRLDDNSMRRMNAKENPAHRARSLLVRKMLYCAGCKLQSDLVIKTPAGVTISLTPDELRSDFYVRYARGSGSPDGRLDLRETAVMFHDKGIIDDEALLDMYQWPDRGAIMQRLAKARANAPQTPPSTAAETITAVAALAKSDPSAVGFEQAQQALGMANIQPQPRNPEMQMLAATKMAKAKQDALPPPAPVIAGKGGPPQGGQ